MMYVCKEHDDDIVVYDRPYNPHHDNRCPLCEALALNLAQREALDDHVYALNEQLDEMRDERDEEREKVRRLEMQLDVFRSQEL